MWVDISGLVLSLVIILISCELFTNSIEWLGKRLEVGDGVVGSILAAVGTCLPETTIPIIAILFSGKTDRTVEIGIGAIIGAPFMLSTLAFFVTGVAVLIFWKKRKTGAAMMINSKILSRDISFFILVYIIGISTGIAASIVDIGMLRYIVALFLISYYIYYIILTIREDSETHAELETLYITKMLDIKPTLSTILFQVALSLGGIVLGAELFVKNMEETSSLLGISALVLSLIITPIATELPEKFNSVLWIRRKKDTLALGNITGAMVFQSCIPVAIGILATSWHLDIKAVLCGLTAICSAAFTYIWLRLKRSLSVVPLIAGGAFYAIFIVFLIVQGFK